VSNNIQIKSGDSVNVSTSTTAPISVKPVSKSTSISVAGFSAALADKNYVHEQSSASATWTITHNLNKRPSVSVVDSAGTQIICEVYYDSDNQVTLTFDDSTAGQAYLN